VINGSELAPDAAPAMAARARRFMADLAREIRIGAVRVVPASVMT
jgi:hypothetical protein